MLLEPTKQPITQPENALEPFLRQLATLYSLCLLYIYSGEKYAVVPPWKETSSRSLLEEALLFRQGTAAYPTPLLLQPGFDFLKAFV